MAGGQGSAWRRRRTQQEPSRPPSQREVTDRRAARSGGAVVSTTAVVSEAGKLILKGSQPEMRKDVREFIRCLEAADEFANVFPHLGLGALEDQLASFGYDRGRGHHGTATSCGAAVRHSPL